MTDCFWPSCWRNAASHWRGSPRPPRSAWPTSLDLISGRLPRAAIVLGSAKEYSTQRESQRVLNLLATLGGLTNALAYAKARKVEASVLTHFMLNAVHFVLFTHPVLAR